MFTNIQKEQIAYVAYKTTRTDRTVRPYFEYAEYEIRHMTKGQLLSFLTICPSYDTKAALARELIKTAKTPRT